MISKKLIASLIILELGVIAYLGINIATKPQRLSINPIGKNQVEVKGSNNLRYFYEPVPDHIDTIGFEWLGKTVKNSINKDSLNERFNYTVKKPKGTMRIVAIGDSFTYGQYVNTEDNWTEVLEDKLNDLTCGKYKDFEVINLGVIGYDVEYEVERFRLRGKKYDPDLVIWMLTDAVRILEKQNPWIKECGRNSKRSTADVPEYDCWTKAEDHLLTEYGHDYINRYLGERLDSLSSFYEGPVIAVNLDGTFNEIYKKSRQAPSFHKLNLNYIRKPAYQLPDLHPNEEGHRYFAKHIYNYLIENEIISCE